MHDTDIVKIKNARSAFRRITEVNQEFLTHANKNTTCSRISSSLQILGDALAVDCFGHLAIAKPRPVRMSTISYFMEYVFTVPFGNQMMELTRFYLSDSGQILDVPTTQDPICSLEHPLIATHLCGRVLLGFLESPLLAPAQVQRCALDIHATSPVTVSG